jgi:hypothetical protein
MMARHLYQVIMHGVDQLSAERHELGASKWPSPRVMVLGIMSCFLPLALPYAIITCLILP